MVLPKHIKSRIATRSKCRLAVWMAELRDREKIKSFSTL